jgi:hypothetical protein
MRGETMMETIGLIMLKPSVAVDKEDAILAASFLPMEQLPDGKVQTIAPKQAAAMRSVGLRPAAAVKAEVIRHGTKITYAGYNVYLLEDLSPLLRQMMEFITPALVDDMVNNFMDELHATKNKIEEA